MPMTKRQLAQVEADYNGWIPVGRVVDVRQRQGGWGDTYERCDLCNQSYPEKHIIIENSMPATYPMLTRIRVLVCRNGVACRRRASRRVNPPAAAA